METIDWKNEFISRTNLSPEFIDIYAESFEENHIDLSLLSELSDDVLQSLGVRSIGHRLQILKLAKRILSEGIAHSDSVPSNSSSTISIPSSTPEHSILNAVTFSRDSENLEQEVQKSNSGIEKDQEQIKIKKENSKSPVLRRHSRSQSFSSSPKYLSKVKSARPSLKMKPEEKKKKGSLVVLFQRESDEEKSNLSRTESFNFNSNNQTSTPEKILRKFHSQNAVEFLSKKSTSKVQSLVLLCEQNILKNSWEILTNKRIKLLSEIIDSTTQVQEQKKKRYQKNIF